MTTDRSAVAPALVSPDMVRTALHLVPDGLSAPKRWEWMANHISAELAARITKTPSMLLPDEAEEEHWDGDVDHYGKGFNACRSAVLEALSPRPTGSAG